MTTEVTELVTARWRLRALVPSDIDDLAALHSDPKVMLGRNGIAIPERRSETEAWLGRALALPHGGGLGMSVSNTSRQALSSGVAAYGQRLESGRTRSCSPSEATTGETDSEPS